jgi:hypothetical protein
MWAIDANEMESSSKIDLRDPLWWISIKDVYRPRALVITRLPKERCISLVIGGRPFHIAHKYD